MSKEDKSAVLQAMKKLKKANLKLAESEQVKTSGSKSFKSDSGKSDIAENIINAVSNLKRKN